MTDLWLVGSFSSTCSDINEISWFRKMSSVLANVSPTDHVSPMTG